MTKTRAEVLLLAVLLVAAWLSLGRGFPSAPPADDHRAPQVYTSSDPVGAGLASRTRALREYLGSPPARVAVRRNPFSFPAPAPVAFHAREGGEAQAAADLPPLPPLTLSGIAEDAGAGGLVRTAVIRAAGQVVFVKEGDRVLARFLVMKIAADAVQLKDTERGDVLTLALK